MGDEKLVTLAQREDELLCAAKHLGRLAVHAEEHVRMKAEREVLRKAVSYCVALMAFGKAEDEAA